MPREYFTMPVTVHLLFLRDGKLLMLRRQNTGFEDGNYSVVAGHLDGGETVTQAAIREAKEEAGVEIEPGDVEVLYVMHRAAPGRGPPERIDFFIRINKWGGEIVNAEPDKCSDLSWFKLDELPQNTIPYVRQGIRDSLGGKTFGEFGF